MRFSRSKWQTHIRAIGGLLILALLGGCARQPPTSNFLSGVRLHVIIHFASPVQQRFYYLFVINNSNNIDAPGPIPVVTSPPVGSEQNSNGFATGSGPNVSGANSGKNTGGFTDFVVYSGSPIRGAMPSNNFALVHVTENTDANDSRNFISNGNPVSGIPPTSDPSDPNSTKIEFEIDLAQLLRDAAGQPISDAIEARTLARQI